MTATQTVKPINENLKRGDLFRMPKGMFKGRVCKVTYSGAGSWLGHWQVDGLTTDTAFPVGVMFARSN